MYVRIYLLFVEGANPDKQTVNKWNNQDTIDNII